MVNRECDKAKRSESEGQADIRRDRGTVIRNVIEEAARLKSCKVEGSDEMRCGRPANLHVTLVSQVSRSGTPCGVHQYAAAKSIYAVTARFAPIPIP